MKNVLKLAILNMIMVLEISSIIKKTKWTANQVKPSGQKL